MKFISSVARRFSECVDFLDEMNDETRKTQRLHSIELRQQMSSNVREIERVLRHAAAQSVPLGVQREIAEARVTRKRARAQERRTKLMSKHALLEA